jgi:subtilisin family serine protease
VAPGGDTSQVAIHGILTAGGTWVPGFWQGMELPQRPWGMGVDELGRFVQVQGTSFSAPATSGVAALMLAANPRLSRTQVTEILGTTASYDGLKLSQSEANQYRLQAQVGFGTVLDSQVLRPTGIFNFPDPVSPDQYYFGQGLVNAAAAVKQAKARR